MSRAVDWSPLAEKDPVAGDSYVVTGEGKYYTDVADEITAQIARLRRISSEQEMLGKTADKLREAAGDLTGKLEKMHGRFATVGSQLTAWVPHLEQAQTDTAAALIAAQAAASAQHRYAAPTKPPGAEVATPTSTAAGPLTPAQQQAQLQTQQVHDAAVAADRVRQNQLDAANAAMTAAQTKFHNALEERDRQARAIADAIRGSLHDGLKDGIWDGVSKWISQHLKAINVVLSVLSWAVTALAITALFVSGGWVIALAAGLAFALLSAHTLMAATGNGSWTDVAIDAFTLLTLGSGAGLGVLAKGARGAALARAGAIEGDAARVGVTVARGGEKQLLEKTAGGFVKRLFSPTARAANRALTGFDDATTALATRAAEEATETLITRALPQVARLAGVKAFGKAIAENMADLRALKALYGGDGEFSNVARYWNALNRAGQGVYVAGEGVDVIDKAFGDSVPGVKPPLGPYLNFKETIGDYISGHLPVPTWGAQ